MIIARSIGKVRKVIGKVRKQGKLVGFIPTMGALHEGHLSLVRAAKKECDFVAVSIFINPTQFGPAEDLRKYPRNFKKDEKLLRKEEVDLIFCPAVKTMYPQNFSTDVEEISLSKTLCGKSRPGHFRGVCMVVAKLFNIILPDIAYFGQKDYQQAKVIKRMVANLDFPIKTKAMPIVREKSGLAMSSRNAYLNLKERKDAAVLFGALKLAKRLIKEGERSSKKIISRMKAFVKSKKTAKIDYIEILNADSLEKLKRIKGKVLIALAVYIGRTRLIDNIVIKVT